MTSPAKGRAVPDERPTEHLDLEGVHPYVKRVLMAAQIDADRRAQGKVTPAHLTVHLFESGHALVIARRRAVEPDEVLREQKACIEGLPTIGVPNQAELSVDTISLVDRIKRLRDIEKRPVADVECLVRALAEGGHLPRALEAPWTEEERRAEEQRPKAATKPSSGACTRWFPTSAVLDLRRDLLSRLDGPSVASTEADRLLRALDHLGEGRVPGLEVRSAEHRVELRAVATRRILVVEWREAVERLELRLVGVQQGAGQPGSARQFQWDPLLHNFIDAAGDALTALKAHVMGMMFPSD